jgi:DNA/RNA-binding domain of Phe-tRNA-synthetase-like protein
MGGFCYSGDLIAAFPGTRAGVIRASGLDNGPTGDELRQSYLTAQHEVRDEIGQRPLSEIPSIAAWRRTFSGFGVKPTQYRSAVEALLRRLTKQGDIPSINALVDMANLVSIRHMLPVAVFDQAHVTGVTTVRFAHGDEPFTDLGADSVSNPEPGEVIFVDDARVVSARRWCWRQSAQSAAGRDTLEALVTIEGQHQTADRDVARATEDMLELLSSHQPSAAHSSRLLSPDDRRFDFG